MTTRVVTVFLGALSLHGSAGDCFIWAPGLPGGAVFEKNTSFHLPADTPHGESDLGRAAH